VSSIIDIAFPYRRRRSYGAASFAFTFLVLLLEVEILAFVGVAIAARQLQLWWDLQPIVFPTACLISLRSLLVARSLVEQAPRRNTRGVGARRYDLRTAARAKARLARRS